MRTLLVTLCLALASALHWPNTLSKDSQCPSMFVAVASSLTNGKRRDEIRPMWRYSADNHPAPFEYKFMLCTSNGVPIGVQNEQERNGDLVFMDCEEGYLNGALTRKIASAMRYYLEPPLQSFDLFMKIDDDTYMSTSRLCNFIEQKQVRAEVPILHNAYMGVFSEGTEKAKLKHIVIRDPKNPWFEPWEKYPYEKYPMSAKGGPGYILSRPLVAEIINRNISEDFELNNEDKAVGYWVKQLRNRVRYVNIPGTDGYDEHLKTIVSTGKFKDYPYILHHHLDGNTIACLHKVEISSPEEIVDSCLSKRQRLWSTRTPQVRIHMPY